MACNPDSSKGACYPRIDFDQDGNCAGPAGGTKTVGTPQFELDVTNPPDLVWKTEDYVPIQDDVTLDVYIFDNI
jgi:hypothetical protein